MLQSLVLLQCQVWRSIVLFRQPSNQRQNKVWITSGRRAIVRICAHSIAPSFPVAVRWCGEPTIARDSRNSLIVSKWSGAASFPRTFRSLGNSLHKSGCCSVDTELIRREATRFSHHYRWSVLISCHVLGFSILSLQRHWRQEMSDDQNLRNSTSCFLQFDPRIRRVYHSRFRTISCVIQAPRKTHDREKMSEHTSPTVCELYSHLTLSSHAMSLYIDMKMILPLKCSGALCRSRH